MKEKIFNILIADDNPDNIDLMKRRLCRDNYIFYTAEDGQKTVDFVQQTPPDLILLDVNMPKLSGFEVCRRLRADEATSSIPIIIITAARISKDDQIMGLGLGADDYITKPFSIKDLTARVARKLQIKALEDKLRSQKEELSAILTSVTDAIIRLGRDEIVQFINKSGKETFGFTNSEQLIGVHYQKLFVNHPTFIKSFEKVKEKATHKPVTFEMEMQDNIFMLTNVSPIATANQKPDGWVMVLRDITYLKKMDNIKSTIIANAAHDLKNPMSAAMLYLEMLVEKVEADNKIEYKLAVNALKSLQRMKQMTSHLLDIERLEAGDALEIEICDMGQLVQELVNQMDGMAEQQEIKLTAKLPNTVALVAGDLIYLSRAITNLMHNALKITPAGGSIIVGITVEAKNIITYIQDTGPGISAEHQAHIFNRFYRIKEIGSKKSISGTGLGLSIVKSIVEQHNGLVCLDSQINQGTTFYINLPRVQQ